MGTNFQTVVFNTVWWGGIFIGLAYAMSIAFRKTSHAGRVGAVIAVAIFVLSIPSIRAGGYDIGQITYPQERKLVGGQIDILGAFQLFGFVYMAGFLGGFIGHLLDGMRGKSTSSGSQRRREIPLNVRDQVFRNAGRRCQQCGKSAADGVRLEVDHIVPVSKGGSDYISNLQLLCFDCNRGKRDRIG